MKNLNRKLSFGVALAMTSAILSCVPSVSASAYDNDSYELDFVENEVKEHISQMDDVDITSLRLSDGFDYYNFADGTSDSRIYFLSANSDVIADIVVFEKNGEYYSVLNFCDYDDLESKLGGNYDVAFGFYDGVILYYDGYEFSELEDTAKDISEVNLKKIPTDDICLEKLSFDNLVYDISLYNSPFAPNCDLRIEHYMEPVPNKTINGKGVCWAAAIAAKYDFENDYYYGDDGYVDATDVYNKVYEVYGSATAGVPKCITKGLDSFGLSSSFKSGDLTPTEIYRELYYDNVVLIDMFGHNSSNQLVGHSVVISGIRVYGNYSVDYCLCDSNFSKVQYAHIPYTHNSDGFYYYDKAYGYAFNEWDRTYSFKYND